MNICINLCISFLRPRLHWPYLTADLLFHWLSAGFLQGCHSGHRPDSTSVGCQPHGWDRGPESVGSLPLQASLLTIQHPGGIAQACSNLPITVTGSAQLGLLQTSFSHVLCVEDVGTRNTAGVRASIPQLWLFTSYCHQDPDSCQLLSGCSLTGGNMDEQSWWWSGRSRAVVDSLAVKGILRLSNTAMNGVSTFRGMHVKSEHQQVHA